MVQTASSSQQINQLLESMNLPKTPEMQQLLAHFMKAELPISKEQLMQAEMWLKALPEGITKMDALQAIQKMVELKMPMTNEIFQALISGQKNYRDEFCYGKLYSSFSKGYIFTRKPKAKSNATSTGNCKAI